jgi:hypothetical protein
MANAVAGAADSLYRSADGGKAWVIQEVRHAAGGFRWDPCPT